MSVKSFNHERSSFTPYQNCLEEKQLSLFSRLNLNDKNSLEHPMRNFAEHDSSDLFSMRSKKRKRSAEIQLKESMPGNRTYLNVSLVGKSSLMHNNDLFGKERYQEVVSGGEYDEEQSNSKSFSQKSCPVGPSNSLLQPYNYFPQLQNNESRMIKSRAFQQAKPRFHKTKNMLRTISSYLHKFILHSKRSMPMKERYFRKILMKKCEEKEEKFSLEIFQKIRINEDDQLDIGDVMIRSQGKKESKLLLLQKSNSQEILSISTPADNQSSQIFSPLQKPWKTMVTSLQIDQKIKQFHEWVESLSVINFVDYEKVWTDEHEFTPLYRQLCYKYYKEEVVCDVMRSRLTTKEITVQYLNQFVEGLFRPRMFYRFK